MSIRKGSLVIFLSFILLPNKLSSQIPLAVLDLDAEGISDSDSRIISERLRTELFKTGKFQVLERDKMKMILNEHSFQSSGCTSNECAIEIGKIIGVRGIIAGVIGKIGNLTTINIRLIDVSTGQILKTAIEDCHCSIEKVLQESVKNVVLKLMSNNISTQQRSNVNDIEHTIKIGIKAGGSFFLSKTDLFSGEDIPTINSESKKNISLSNFGLYFNYLINDYVSIQPEVVYNKRLNNYKCEVEGDASHDDGLYGRDVKFTYISIPVNIKLNIINTKSIKPYILIGPSISVLVSKEIRETYPRYDVNWIIEKMDKIEPEMTIGLGIDKLIGNKKIFINSIYSISLKNTSADVKEYTPGSANGDYYFQSMKWEQTTLYIYIGFEF
jgi:TolB-like protein